jgi:septum site-determining protein MinC
MAATGPTPTSIDYEPAGELKIGQVGIANLRVRTLDVEQLAAEMRDRVTRAPKLFARAAVVVDFGGLAKTPDPATARALLDALRDAGVLPVALAYGTSANEALARELGLPLLAKFRAQYEPATGGAPAVLMRGPNFLLMSSPTVNRVFCQRLPSASQGSIGSTPKRSFGRPLAPKKYSFGVGREKKKSSFMRTK